MVTTGDRNFNSSKDLAPLGFLLWTKYYRHESLYFRNRVILRPRSGWVPEEASSAQPLQVLLNEFEGGRVGFNVMTSLCPDYPQRGPYEASEGIYPGRGQGKAGGGDKLSEGLKN